MTALAAQARHSHAAARNEREAPLSAAGMILRYSVLFIIGALCFFSANLIAGESLLWRIDGFEQQYPFFVLEGQWLRDVFATLFIDHSFALPLWDQNQGYGADAFVTMAATIGNPINLLSVFATPENAEYWLEATVPITLYLSGLAFIGFCRYKGYDDVPTLFGAIVLIFSGYSMIAFSQLLFVYPLLLGVLGLWGVEKLIEDRKAWLLIVAMGLSALYSLTQLYSTMLLLAVYAIVRFITLPEGRNAKTFLRWFVTILGSCVIGALLAAIVLLPMTMTILGEGRLGISRPWNLLYGGYYYADLFTSTLETSNVGADCYIGLIPIAFVTLITLFVLKDQPAEGRLLKILAIVFLVFLLLPPIGRVFNGFAYPNNRWAWAVALLITVIFTVIYPRLARLDAIERRRLSVILIVYGLLSILLMVFVRRMIFLFEAIVLLCVLATMFAGGLSRRSFDRIMGALIFIALLVRPYWDLFNDSQAFKDGFIDRGGAYEMIVANHPATMLPADDDTAAGEGRYDTYKHNVARNSEIVNGHPGATFYNSYYNQAIDDYHKALGLATSPMNFSFDSLQGRTVLEALGGVEYFIAPADNATFTPALFTTEVAEREIGGVDYVLYRNDDPLPLAFFYDQSLSEADFEAASLMQRQDDLVQAVVLDEGPSTLSPVSYTTAEAATLSLSDPSATPLKAERYDPEQKAAFISIDDRTITTRRPNLTVYIETTIPANTEGYLSFTNLSFTPFNERQSLEGDDWNSMRRLQKAKVLVTDALTNLPDVSTIEATTGGDTALITCYTANAHLNGGKSDWLLNLGSSGDERHVIAVTFANPGVYSFDDIEVGAQNTADVRDAIVRLEQNAPETTRFTDANTVECTAVAPAGARYLYFRIPHSRGWSATVNGQAAPLLTANLGFMALAVPEGATTMDVTLHYETPYLGLGALLSLIGVVAFVAVIVLERTVLRPRTAPPRRSRSARRDATARNVTSKRPRH